MAARQNLTGQRFGRLVVEGFSHAGNASYWYCRCDCGKISVARGTSLRYGSTKTCGCGSKEQAARNAGAYAKGKRGPCWPHTRTLRQLHRNMLRRCYDARDRRYCQYGGRGIAVCEQWRIDRDAFIDWVISQGWCSGATMDRINNDGNYEPDNVRFVGAIVQANNTSRNRFLEWDGKKMTVSDWARHLGVSSWALQHRVDRGWTVERIITQEFRCWP